MSVNKLYFHNFTQAVEGNLRVRLTFEHKLGPPFSMKISIYIRLLKEGLFFATNALVVNKLRTFLSLLGVTIGIFAIISVFTLVDSMEQSVRGSFSRLGNNAVFIERMPWGPEESDKEYAWWKYSKRPNVKFSEAEVMFKRMTTAEYITFFSGAQRVIEYDGKSVENAIATAVYKDFEQFITVDVGIGRSFTMAEIEGNARVCLLGNDVAERLFGYENGIGKSIKIGGFKCTVIGILKKEGSGLLGNDADERALIPVGFSRSILNINEGSTRIAMKPKPGVDVKAMEDEAMMVMRSVRQLRLNQDRNFAVNKTSMLSSSLDDLFGYLSLAGLIIGGFSILVGGFSIANIMFVSVRERTNIIGIQKALGAKRSFILFQFLFESVILCLIGGMFGLILIYPITLLASEASAFALQLSLKNVLIGLGFSIGIGLISGIVPASLAARMQPVDAMRSTA